MPKGKGKPLNPKSPLTETEQRGVQVRINREVDAYEDFQKSIAGGSVANPKTILKKAARRNITAEASRDGVQRMLEARRTAASNEASYGSPNSWDWDTD